MEKQKVYIETSVVSYLNARSSKNPIIFGRQQLTHEWWNGRRVFFDVVVSELVFQEASAGDGEDALHIAVCAVNGIDFFLTWNCKHLANAIHRQEIEKLVEMHGYACPVICTPAELMEE